VNLLREIFDKVDRPVALVSSYDNTITYLNGAAAKIAGLPVSELIGSSVTETLERLQVAMPEVAELIATTPLLRCLDGSWWVASAVPCADPLAPEVFASGYAADSAELALAQHEVLSLRAAIAMEHSRTQRLLNAAVAACHEANRRLEFMGTMLADAGKRPINPVNKPAAPL
jgi:hypothetical protein